MSPPLEAPEMTFINGVVDNSTTELGSVSTVPAKVNDPGPFPSFPSVTM